MWSPVVGMNWWGYYAVLNYCTIMIPIESVEGGCLTDFVYAIYFFQMVGWRGVG